MTIPELFRMAVDRRGHPKSKLRISQADRGTAMNEQPHDIADLVAVSQGQTNAGRKTRQLALEMLTKLAREGNEEARAAMARLGRARRGSVAKFKFTMGERIRCQEKQR